MGRILRHSTKALMAPMAQTMLTLLRLAALSFAAISAAHADSAAHIVQTQPAGDASLGHQESFWVRIEYNTDEAISLWARPYRNGTQVKEAMSNASLTYTGSGEALGWFALIERGDVDEVRVFAGGGKPFREWELARHSVRLRWTDGRPSAVPQTPWVTELLAMEKARYHEDAQRRASEPVPIGDLALFNGFMLAVLALFIASVSVPLWSVWKWHGGWRVAATMPVAIILFVVLRIVIDTTRDPTSHNLWPFEILQFGVVALLIVGGLKLARRLLGVQR
jgi:hypothetical protein